MLSWGNRSESHCLNALQSEPFPLCLGWMSQFQSESGLSSFQHERSINVHQSGGSFVTDWNPDYAA